MIDKELKILAPLFKEKSLKVVVYKGWSLHSLYEDGERGYTDIDLIVTGNPDTVETLLCDNGYHKSSHNKGGFEKPPLAIDMHSRISDLTGPIDFEDKNSAFSFDLIELENHLEEIGDNIFKLKDHVHFIFLCTHWLVRHGAERQLWAEDIKRLYIKINNNDEIFDLAKKWGLFELVDLALLVLKEDYGFEALSEMNFSPRNKLLQKRFLFPLNSKSQRFRLWWCLFPRYRLPMIKKMFWPSIEFRKKNYGSSSIISHWKALASA